ncbi:rod shape-determining protein [bacterium]|nr:rod shape-determining protein [bacterium]
MAFSFKNMFVSQVAIDLGTANTLVYVKGEGIMLDEPSIVAYDKNEEIIAIGKEAREMLGRAPGEIKVIRPLRDGVIANFEATEQMLKTFIKKVQVVRPTIIICVPSGVTEVERRAVRDSAERAGAKLVKLIYEPMAAAIGVGLDVSQPVGNMIIDIGGGTTEIAVISLNGIVVKESIKCAGDEMDKAILNYFKRKHNLLIGEKTAEEIKITLGSAIELTTETKTTVKGRDLIGGAPKVKDVTSEEIREALEVPIKRIIEAAKLTLERTPPELASDILDRGIMVTGGGALLKGLDERLRKETSLPIHIAEDPLKAVVLGTARALEDMKNYVKILF